MGLTLSCGIVVVKKSKNGYMFLMLNNRNVWEPPKGKQENDESLLETALREVEEETSLQPTDLNFKWGRVHTISEKYGKNKQAVFFVAETSVEKITLPINHEIGRAEHSEYKWVSYDQARQLASDRISKILEWAQGVIKQ